MQDTGNAFEIKRPGTESNLIYTYRLLYQNLMVTTNQKSAIDRYTKRKRNPNTTLNLVFKSQEKNTKEKGKKKDLQSKSKTINKWQQEHTSQ